jgi:NADH-quinone oxidoreductase subunit M
MITGLLIFFPLVAALLTLAAKGENARKIALVSSLAELGLALYALSRFTAGNEVHFLLDFWWMEDLGISFKAGIDGISMILVLLTTLLVPLIILSSSADRYKNASLFYCLVLVMQMALVGVFVALDGFLFYIFWELALIPIYFICLLWGGERRAPVTFKFFIYTLFGSLVMLVGFIYLYLQTPGSHSFDIAALYHLSLDSTAQSLVFWAFFLAFAIKMPVFPFHTWQPDTYAESPAQGTMLLSGIMLKMGIYGVIRWVLPVVPLGVREWGTLAVILSVAGIVYASCIAIVQKDLKRLIAYSSIAHVGLISAGIFTGSVQGLQGAMIQMLSHGINVVGLFYVVDIINTRLSTRDLSLMGGIRTTAPQFATLFVIILLGSVALPLTNGFVGEFMLLNGVYKYNTLLGAVAGLTIILGAVYMLNAYQKSVLGESSAHTASAGFAEVTGREKLVLGVVCALVLLIGVYPGPLLRISEPAVNQLVQFINSK